MASQECSAPKCGGLSFAERIHREALGDWGRFSLPGGATNRILMEEAPRCSASPGALANLAAVTLRVCYRGGDANVRSVWLCTRNDLIQGMAVANRPWSG